MPGAVVEAELAADQLVLGGLGLGQAWSPASANRAQE